MSLRSQVRSWTGSVFRRSRIADELAEEISFHVNSRAADLEAEGAAPAEAMRRARAEIGSTARSAEQYREAIGMRYVDETMGDVRYGLRGLWRNKGFAAIAILSLSLGIGATTAMFSIVYAVLLDIYPYADSQRTVNPIVHDPAVPDDWNWFVLNRAQYAQYKSAHSFEDVFGQTGMGIQLDENDIQQPLRVTLLTANAESFNRVGPLFGRGLQASDGDYGATPPNVIVLGYKFWKTHYLADRGVIGRDFKAGSKLYRVVGVMPERYTLGNADVYMPMSQYTFPDPYLIAFAKLKPGVSAKQASDEVEPMLHEFAKQDPRMYPENFHARLQPLLDGFTTRSKVLKNFPMLYMAVGSLLLIGCANCSLLLLARGTTRTHEFALRSAVGASRVRIVRQMLVECLTIAFLGSCIGVVLAYVLARLPLQLADDLFPGEAVIRINMPILLFSVGLAVVAGLLFGLLPALKFSRPEISQVLQANSRRTVAAGGRRPLQVLIGLQLALTLVLLTVSGAAISGFVRLMHFPLGYQPQGVSAIGVGYKKDDVKTWPERVARRAAYRSQLEAVPGVTSVATAVDIPPSGGGTQPFEIVGDTSMHEMLARQTNVSPEYFRTLQISLLQGRVWDAAEMQQGLPLAVVNESFVRRFSPHRSLLNRTVRFPKMELKKLPPSATLSPAMQKPDVQIVGIVGDVVNDGLDKPVMPTVYINDTTLLWPGALFLVRTAGDPATFTRSLAHAIRQLDKNSYVSAIPYTLQQMVEREAVYRTQRLLAVLLAIFAGLAFALSLVGLYSVVAYVVAQRTSEFGIRLALGAQRPQIVSLVMRGNAPVVLGGTCAGLAISFVLRTRFQQWSEYSSQSSLLLPGAALLLVLAALVATWYPAFRASRVQPSTALRAE